MATADQKEYYGYLFDSNKLPTKVLDALLRGIARYITDCVGNKEEKSLTPAKLAAFYKAVGGNYDSLFVDVPSPSISWIYASIGCQHTLQPTDNDFKLPEIPALTTKGFVRWQSIEILLTPEEHVPFIQYAVRNFGITNPDNGEIFPVDLPKEAFPLHPDKDVETWHNKCAERLRQRATPNEDEGFRPDLPPRTKVQEGYSHVRAKAGDYFEPQSRSRPIPYQHVSSRPVRPTLNRSPSHKRAAFLAPESPPARGRRASYPDNVPSPSQTSPPSNPVFPDNSQNLRPAEASQRRRHSHSHSHSGAPRRGSVSSDASSEPDPPSPKSNLADVGAERENRHKRRDDFEKPQLHRYSVPSGATNSPVEGAIPAPTPPDPRARRNRDHAGAEEEELKRRSFPIPIDLTGKLSAPFLLSNRGKGRSDSRGNNVRWKDLDGADLWRRGSEEERDIDTKSSRTQSREDRNRERERADSGSSGSRRRHHHDRDRDSRLDLPTARPNLRDRKYSSHDDLSRATDGRRRKDYERDSTRGDGRGDGRSYRERDRARERERRASPLRGVDGRAYPAVR